MPKPPPPPPPPKGRKGKGRAPKEPELPLYLQYQLRPEAAPGGGAWGSLAWGQLRALAAAGGHERRCC